MTSQHGRAVVMVIPPFDITEVNKDATIMTQHVFISGERAVQNDS